MEQQFRGRRGGQAQPVLDALSDKVIGKKRFIVFFKSSDGFAVNAQEANGGHFGQPIESQM
jgi:hypothetical protein